MRLYFGENAGIDLGERFAAGAANFSLAEWDPFPRVALHLVVYTYGCAKLVSRLKIGVQNVTGTDSESMFS